MAGLRRSNRIPKKAGRLGLCHLLTKNGGVRSEFTVYRTGAERFYLVGAGAFERHDFDTLVKLLPASGGVQLQKITTQMGVLVLAGPRSRELLQKLTDSDFSNAAFPWLSGQFINVGIAEANMVSTGAGFAKAGFIPIVDTFGQFGVTKGNLPLTMAALSQAPVIAMFSHVGFQDAADGASHQATT